MDVDPIIQVLVHDAALRELLPDTHRNHFMMEHSPLSILHFSVSSKIPSIGFPNNRASLNASGRLGS